MVIRTEGLSEIQYGCVQAQWERLVEVPCEGGAVHVSWSYEESDVTSFLWAYLWCLLGMLTVWPNALLVLFAPVYL